MQITIKCSSNKEFLKGLIYSRKKSNFLSSINVIFILSQIHINEKKNLFNTEKLYSCKLIHKIRLDIVTFSLHLFCLISYYSKSTNTVSSSIFRDLLHCHLDIPLKSIVCKWTSEWGFAQLIVSPPTLFRLINVGVYLRSLLTAERNQELLMRVVKTEGNWIVKDYRHFFFIISFRKFGQKLLRKCVKLKAALQLASMVRRYWMYLMYLLVKENSFIYIYIKAIDMYSYNERKCLCVCRGCSCDLEFRETVARIVAKFDTQVIQDMDSSSKRLFRISI